MTWITETKYEYYFSTTYPNYNLQLCNGNHSSFYEDINKKDASIWLPYGTTVGYYTVLDKNGYKKLSKTSES